MEAEEQGSFPKKKTAKLRSSINKLDPFIDGHGVLRVGGRLKHADLSDKVKHPPTHASFIATSCLASDNSAFQQSPWTWRNNSYLLIVNRNTVLENSIKHVCTYVRKIGAAFLSSREVSSQECVYRCMPELWLRNIFSKTVFVSTDLPEKRLRPDWNL